MGDSTKVPLDSAFSADSLSSARAKSRRGDVFRRSFDDDLIRDDSSGSG